MTEERLNQLYFKWMCRKVYHEDYLDRTALLRRLHRIDFSYSIDRDGNRAEDGVSLRYRFGYETNTPDFEIAAHLDNRPCSVLEMMVALALRCEEHIMSDPEVGDRMAKWFWDMIESLGLGSVTDETWYWDENDVDIIINRFLLRDYAPTGKGGLFTLKHCRQDLRNVEIWYQACWYMNENIGEGG